MLIFITHNDCKKGVGGLNHEVKKKIQKINIFISKVGYYVKRNKRTYRQI
jgi:hypothetical protein